MPVNPRHEGVFTLLDYSNEKSHFTFGFGPITALTIADFLSEFGDLRTALGNITLGTLVEDTWKGDVTKYSVSLPSDNNAQRERKFLVTYEDTTTYSVFRFEVPTAKFTTTAGSVFKPNSDDVDLTNTQIAAFVTAFEAIGESPDGNGVNVLHIRGVGRNL